MTFNALIFDFDGTIADTLGEGLRIYNLLAAEHHFRRVTREDLTELRALDTRDLLRHLGIPKRKVPAMLTKGRRLLKAKIRSLPLIEGMADVLPRLRHEASCFGILTSNTVENVEAFLEAHGLSDLFTFISATSKLSGKAKHLRSIARTFSLPPAEMLYVGDELRDVKAAERAGIASAAVTWGFNSADSLAARRPRFLVHSPADLLNIIGCVPP